MVNWRRWGDFEKILPGEITDAATRTPADTEWIIPFPEVEQAIQFASRHLIAVLGVEIFRVPENGLGVENFSGYEFDPEGDWTAFVTRNNEAALKFIAENIHGTGYRSANQGRTIDALRLATSPGAS
ncbi:MAG: hypothetical protein JWO80_3893 [Bryobacterales bacterium]|nr:hypothetical protein [Bryobacterales bacterium]